MNKCCSQSLLSLMLLAAVAAAPVGVRAGEPTDQIRQTTDKILAIVQNPAMKGADKEAERQNQMRKAVDGRFDWTTMAKSAMGRNWRELNEAQRKEFSSLFSDLIEKTYMSRIESYSGEKIQYKSEKVDGPYGQVDVVIVTLRGTDIPVSYRVLKKGAEWMVYDVNIEGVSLVNNYRSQISSILNSSNYANLISRLKTKIAEKAEGTPDKAKAKDGI